MKRNGNSGRTGASKQAHATAPRKPYPPGASPRNGVVPPAEHRIPKGTTLNPRGCVTAGATLRQQLNALAQAGLTEKQLRNIAGNKSIAWTRRSAAKQILLSMEVSDIADMEPLLNGAVSLEQLRKKGVDTSRIKKIKVRTRTLYEGDEETGTEVEREVELHNRATDVFGVICDQTEGRPKQTLDVTSGDEPIRGLADAEVAADQILDRLRERLGARPDDPA